jgi:hypothetical protein
MTKQIQKQECSEHECAECGKQLWKVVWIANACFDDGYSEFCSKKCGFKFYKKYLEFEKEEI